ncbi:MAG: hypothetical protein AAFP82_19275, partial [Bacteroidota bacterium]
IGLIAWGLSENNFINASVDLKNEVETFDHDLGDHKLFPKEYKVIVDWGKQKFIYGSGNQTITLKRNSSITYDLSWVPFFKNYYQNATWEVAGTDFDRAPIELKIKSKRYGFLSRSEMQSELRQKATKQLLRSLQAQTFYHFPNFSKESPLIFSKC